MKIYAVDYWVPFPSSEYGGLQIWAAQDKGALEQLMLDDAEKDGHSYNRSRWPDWQEYIKHAAKHATELKLDKSGLLEEFTT